MPVARLSKTLLFTAILLDISACTRPKEAATGEVLPQLLSSDGKPVRLLSAPVNMAQPLSQMGTKLTKLSGRCLARQGDSMFFAGAMPVVMREQEADKAVEGKEAGGYYDIEVYCGTEVTVSETKPSFVAEISVAVDTGNGWQPPTDPNDPDLWKRQHICGGSLIAPGWVLTAAHCVWAENAKSPHLLRYEPRIRLGTSDISRRSLAHSYKIDRLVVHAGYDAKRFYWNDIALVHFDDSGAAQDSKLVTSIKLNSNASLQHGTPLSVAGWGLRANPPLPPTRTPNFSSLLMRGEVNSIENSRCAKIIGFETVDGRPKIYPGIVCAGDADGTSCPGDSGGPLVLNGSTPVLVGIVSWNRKHSCQDPRATVNEAAKPGFYTNVAHFANWINAAIHTSAANGPIQCLPEPTGGAAQPKICGS